MKKNLFWCILVDKGHHEVFLLPDYLFYFLLRFSKMIPLRIVWGATIIRDSSPPDFSVQGKQE